VHAGLAEIGLARPVGGNLVANSLELTAPHIFKILSFGHGRGGLVEVHRNSVALRNFRSHVPSHDHAVFQRDAVNGNEGNHVGGTHAGVRALVAGQVDQLGGLSHAANRGLLDGLPFANQRNHRAVVVGIHLAVEQEDAGDPHGFDNGVDFGYIAAFREIGNAFNNRAGHAKRIKRRRALEQTGQAGESASQQVSKAAGQQSGDSASRRKSTVGCLPNPGRMSPRSSRTGAMSHQKVSTT
jgi:hypothetical protein